jgi:hypothetical protein
VADANPDKAIDASPRHMFVFCVLILFWFSWLSANSDEAIEASPHSDVCFSVSVFGFV